MEYTAFHCCHNTEREREEEEWLVSICCSVCIALINGQWKHNVIKLALFVRLKWGTNAQTRQPIWRQCHPVELMCKYKKQKREPSFTSQKLYFNDQTSFLELI